MNMHGSELSYHFDSPVMDNHDGVIVIIHGALGNSETTADLSKHLVESLHNYAVLRVDLPGHGESPGMPLESVEDMAKVITAFVNALKETYGENVILVGHSMGGSVVLQSVADGLKVRKAAILMSAPEWGSMEPMFGIEKEQIVPAFYGMMQLEFAGLPNEDELVARISSMAASPEAGLADIKALSQFNILPKVYKLAVPLLIVASDNDGTATPESIEALASRLPDYDSYVVEGGTHTSVIARAAEVAGAVFRFVIK